MEYVNGGVPDFLDRSAPLLTTEGIARLREVTVSVAGCGGVGGAVALSLARMGVGRFRLADPAGFDPPDMNRQWGALTTTLARNKASVYRELVAAINPDADITAYTEGLTDDNCRRFTAGADIVVDCLDANVAHELRVRLHDAARRGHALSTVAPILGFGCFVLCSAPDGMLMDFWLETIRHAKSLGGLPGVFSEYFVPEHMEVVGGGLETGRIPSVAPAPALGAALLSTECVAYAIGDCIPGFRPPIVLPEVLFIDLVRTTYRIVDITDLRPRFVGATNP